MTLTTRYKFTPQGVENANNALTKLLRWLKHEDPSMKYTSGMDVTPGRSLIHFNVVIDGALPKKKAVKDYWHLLTGCHDIKIKPAHSNSGYYLAKRASELPNAKDGHLADWGITARGFRRIRPSVNLYPSEKKKLNKTTPWTGAWVETNDEHDLDSNSMVADTALPRKAGDIADRPSLTARSHGHEDEHRRQGVLVANVRTGDHRRGTNGDSREPDTIRPTRRRASEGLGSESQLAGEIR